MTKLPNNNLLKVCLVSSSLANGGLERSCAMLSQMLEKRGFEVFIVVLNNEVGYPYQGELLNLGALKSGRDTVIKRFKRLAKLRKFLKSNAIDVVIDHRSKNQYKRELFYHLYVYKAVEKIYVTHSSNARQFLTESPSKFAKICRSNLTNVAVSTYIEKEMLKKAGIENSVTIYNAFNPEWEERDATKLPEVLQGKSYILSYGRIEDDIKDFSFLIDAFEVSEVWKGNKYLVIMGEGKDKLTLIEKAASSPAKDYIVFLPFAKNPFSIVSQAHCVTLTSKYEGFPMVLVESLSMGVPVVALDIVSGPSEIIKHRENGLLIEKRNLPLFANSLTEICTDETLYNHCVSNAKDSVKQFSMEEISATWMKLLRNE